MRKHDQRVRKLLGGQEGSMAPLAVAAAIAMLIIILGVSVRASLPDGIYQKA